MNSVSFPSKNILKKALDRTSSFATAFSSVFGKGTIVYAVAVSLGNNISDDNYSGEVEPVNIHIPFFLGIFHEFLNRCLGIKKYLDRENNHARETISQCQSAIDHENNRWFFTDYNRINQCAKQIQAENLNIAENEKQLQKYRTLLNASFKISSISPSSR